MTTLGKRIRQLREEREWRQADLAERLGVTASAVTQWERGQRVPDPAMLERIADTFGVSVDYLLGRTRERDAAIGFHADDALPKHPLPRLRALRIQAGLTTEELAKLSGVPRSVIEASESGDAVCSGYDLVRLATALNVSAAFLAGKSDDPTIKTQLPPELEQLVDEIIKGGWTADDVRIALRMLGLARGRQDDNDER